MKNVKAAISSWRGSRGGKFEDWGGGGGLRILGLGGGWVAGLWGLLLLRGRSVAHYMPWTS